MFREAIGQKVASCSVKELQQDEYEMQYVDRGNCAKPVKSVTLQLETCGLYFSWPGQCVLCDENGRPAHMTMGELKEAVSYYSELFDKRPE